MCAPDYLDIQSDGIPEYQLNGTIRVRVIAGESNGISGAVQRPPELFSTNPLYLDIHFEDVVCFEQALNPLHNAFLFVYRGHVSVVSEGEKTTVSLHRMAILQNEGNGVVIEGSPGAKVLLIAGQPLNESIAQYGPFVMNTRDELIQAVDDFRAGLYNS
jgi:redox-sensitive bicupin YhaK (pirin superfamily)